MLFRSRAQVWESQEEQWFPLYISKKEDLLAAMEEFGGPGLAADDEMNWVHDLVGKGQELHMEVSDEGGLRCRGILVLLTIVHEKKVLVHRAATAQTVRLEDPRILTTVCNHNEEWSAAMTRFAKEVLLLGDDAVTKLLDGCFAGKAEAFMTKHVETGSVCRHHEVCRTLALSLEYDALHLTFRLDPKDRTLFAPILDQTFQTEEEMRDLRDFGPDTLGLGTIMREWEWMPEAEVTREVVGWKPTEQQSSVNLTRKAREISCLLVGIECSAPLKEDLFGGQHGPDAKPKVTSAFGKRKWKDYIGLGVDIPSHCGGMEVKVDKAKFDDLIDLCDYLELSKPSDGVTGTVKQHDEMQLFRSILQDSDAKNNAVILEMLALAKGIEDDPEGPAPTPAKPQPMQPMMMPSPHIPVKRPFRRIPVTPCAQSGSVDSVLRL